MSFTNGKPFELTDEMLKMPWSGFRDGRTLRCHLCGEFFLVGSTVRFVYANFKGGPRCGNFLVCVKCDGPDVLDRAAVHYQESRTRFWHFHNHDYLPAHPELNKTGGPR